MDKSSALSNLLKPHTLPEVSYKVTSVAKIYPNSIRIFKPNKPFDKKYDEFTLINPVRKLTNKLKTSNEDNDGRSLRRTKATIHDYALCNEFELFVTFTFKSDRHNIKKLKKQMSTWLTNQQKIHGKFSYLIVAELHKDGAIHFHALIKGYKGKLVLAVSPKTNKPIIINGKNVYNLAGYKLGHSLVELVDNNKGSLLSSAHYLTKYLGKDMILFPGKKRYWASRGLAKPQIIYNPDPLSPDHKLLDTYPTEYGDIEIYEIPKGAQEPDDG